MRNARIKKTLEGVALVTGILLILAACAPSATPVPPTAVPTNPPPPTAVPPTEVPPTAMPAPTTAPQDTPAAPAAPPAPKAVTLQLVKNDQLGSFIADGDGNTLYLFTKDTPNVTNCYDKCLAAWPA